MVKGAIHAVYREGSWAVEDEDEGVLARYPTREEAVTIARAMARARNVDCIVHRMDGTIDELGCDKTRV